MAIFALSSFKYFIRSYASRPQINSLRHLRHDVEKRRLYSRKNNGGRPNKQPKKALTWMLVPVQSKTPTPSTEARKYEGESGNHGVPAAFWVLLGRSKRTSAGEIRGPSKPSSLHLMLDTTAFILSPKIPKQNPHVRAISLTFWEMSQVIRKISPAIQKISESSR